MHGKRQGENEFAGERMKVQKPVFFLNRYCAPEGFAEGRLLSRLKTDGLWRVRPPYAGLVGVAIHLGAAVHKKVHRFRRSCFAGLQLRGCQTHCNSCATDSF